MHIQKKNKQKTSRWNDIEIKRGLHTPYREIRISSNSHCGLLSSDKSGVQKHCENSLDT